MSSERKHVPSSERKQAPTSEQQDDPQTKITDLPEPLTPERDAEKVTGGLMGGPRIRG